MLLSTILRRQQQQKQHLPTLCQRGTTALFLMILSSRDSAAMTTNAAPNATTLTPTDFYVIAREHGKVRSDLPVWASKQMDPFQLGENQQKITDNGESCVAMERRNVKGVPGAFQILNVFSKEETQRMVDKFEELGFTEDAAVSLPRSVRHNSNLNWIADDRTLEIIWDRCKDFFSDDNDEGGVNNDKKPLGLNGKFRVYRYEPNDFFKIHTDGSWPGSRVVNGKMVVNSFVDRWSMYSFLVFLSQDFEGGETEFLVNKFNLALPARNMQEAETIGIRTPVGGVLCFPHGEHPLHCLHASATITKGVKYIIRSDVLFEL
ncbi:Oxidoreductase, 2OG-Fe(II) oxygenase family [Seminavis robusta]|uniref:Oxidoreductase, 2OG-Fe(II) oxygenase family n=1 Tax=Seminavis robusta TaxID=568900 RepID=A0A9N8D863_9STRA|nr:Oxidoreductase, 2OG-Fe(II) oxygenase family [Seminavis robusta]|eukprot:Sro32_g020670.1 Oxidoreductase, 2OG-Fe(II) oxygenase family (319) ;mRNA; f:33053-34114